MVSFERFQIAPCGINCGTCRAYLRERNKCSGCMSSSGKSPAYCTRCGIKNCESLSKTTSEFCYGCEDFPCLKLRKIDKRYRTRYETGLINNLESIRKTGIENYLKVEGQRWTCPNCGSALCVHLSNCTVCGGKYSDPLFRKNVPLPG